MSLRDYVRDFLEDLKINFANLLLDKIIDLTDIFSYTCLLNEILSTTSLTYFKIIQTFQNIKSLNLPFKQPSRALKKNFIQKHC